MLSWRSAASSVDESLDHPHRIISVDVILQRRR
jgi:hypothetical protein